MEVALKLYLKYAFEVFEEIEQLTKTKAENYYEQIVEKLSSYFLSEKFINISFIQFKYLKNHFKIFSGFPIIFSVCELNEEKLFFKIFFPLLEKLMKNNFEKNLEKLKDIEKMTINDIKEINAINLEELEKVNEEKYNRFGKNFGFKLSQHSFVESIKEGATILILCIKYLFNCFELGTDVNEINIKKDDFISKFRNEIIFFREQIFELYDYFIKLNNLHKLYYTQDIFQLLLSFINYSKAQDKSAKFVELKDHVTFKKLEKLTIENNLKDNFIWFLFDGKKNTEIIGKKYGSIKFSINFFEIINKKESNNSIISNICKSFIDNEEIILLEINKEKFNEKKIEVKEMENMLKIELEQFKVSNLKLSKCDSYILLGNNFIEFKETFYPFLDEMLNNYFNN